MRSGGGGLSKEGKPSNISEAQRQEMLRLANLGWTTLRIARELGLSQSPVSKHLRSMGVVRGTGWKPAKEASA
jgi:DNA-binding NarL/FixJ family response regulator